MKEFKGTKGDWEVRSKYGSVGVSYEGDRFYYSEICKIDYLIHGSEELANAKLIAAAPDLLKALQGLVDDCRNNMIHNIDLEQAERAIERALEE